MGVASVQLDTAWASLLNIFKFWINQKLISNKCYELCSPPPPSHPGLWSSYLFCGSSKGTGARVCILIVWIKYKWISATVGGVQSKEAAAARSPWLPYTLHKGAEASKRPPGRPGEDFAKPLHIPGCPVSSSWDKGSPVGQRSKPRRRDLPKHLIVDLEPKKDTHIKFSSCHFNILIVSLSSQMGRPAHFH